MWLAKAKCLYCDCENEIRRESTATSPCTVYTSIHPYMYLFAEMIIVITILYTNGAAGQPG